MSDNTKISWSDRTWNPLLGCTRISEGCDGCYAINTAHIRASNPHPKVAAAFAGLTERRDNRIDWTDRVNLLADRLEQPLHWRKPSRVFVNSQADLFHEAVPDEFVAKVFAVMVAAPQHSFQVLTKRHGRMRSLLSSETFWVAVSTELGRLWKATPPAPLRMVPAWIWLGVSVETQRWADIRIPALAATPAAVRWASAEPLLGPLSVARWFPALSWVVAGGESGRKARPPHPDWFRTIRDECLAAGVAYHLKQWGEWSPDRSGQHKVTKTGYRYPVRIVGPNGEAFSDVEPENLSPAFASMYRKGTKVAGRLLDGRVWDEFPAARAAV